VLDVHVKQEPILILLSMAAVIATFNVLLAIPPLFV